MLCVGELRHSWLIVMLIFCFSCFDFFFSCFFVIRGLLASARMSSLIVVFHYAIVALKSFLHLRVDFADDVLVVIFVCIWVLVLLFIPFLILVCTLNLNSSSICGFLPLLDLLDDPLSLMQPPLQKHYLLFECFDL